MPATMDQIHAVLGSGDFTAAEKFVVRAQYQYPVLMSNFEEKLWELICGADDSNLAKIGLGFPLEVAAVIDWQRGDLAERIRAAGLPI